MTIYDDSYLGKLERIKELLASGEKSLPRILNIIEGMTAEDVEQNRFLREIDLSRKYMGYALDGQIVKSRELEYPDAMRLHRAMVSSLCLKSIKPTTNRLIELGCGVGVNLVNLWLQGISRDMELLGLEISSSGRDCISLLSELDGNLNLSAHAFDYNSPSFSMVESDKETMVMTVHSVEQIKDVDEELIRNIYSIPGFTHCVHLEPVGWQMAGPEDENAWLNYQARAWSTLRNAYNVNLISVLKSLEAVGEIRIDKMVANVGGLHAGNANALIVWSKA
jgi:hypothetical protein